MMGLMDLQVNKDRLVLLEDLVFQVYLVKRVHLVRKEKREMQDFLDFQE